jgi:hypothetical protein
MADSWEARVEAGGSMAIQWFDFDSGRYSTLISSAWIV